MPLLLAPKCTFPAGTFFERLTSTSPARETCAYARAAPGAPATPGPPSAPRAPCSPVRPAGPTAPAGPGSPFAPGLPAIASWVRIALERSCLAIDPSLICLPVISLAAVAVPAVATSRPSANASNMPARPWKRIELLLISGTRSVRRVRGSGWRRAIALALVDLAPGGREHVPLGAEVLEALAGGVAGLLVAGVEVERVAVVGHLAFAAGGGDRGELAPERPARGGGRAGGQRRPRAQAGARAVALGGRVGLEEVERAAVAVDEDLAQRGVPDGDGRLRGGRGGRTTGCRVTGGLPGLVRLRGVGTTAGGDREDADGDGDDDDDGDDPGHEGASWMRVGGGGAATADSTREDDRRGAGIPIDGRGGRAYTSSSVTASCPTSRNSVYALTTESGSSHIRSRPLSIQTAWSH